MNKTPERESQVPIIRNERELCQLMQNDNPRFIIYEKFDPESQAFESFDEIVIGEIHIFNIIIRIIKRMVITDGHTETQFLVKGFISTQRQTIKEFVIGTSQTTHSERVVPNEHIETESSKNETDIVPSEVAEISPGISFTTNHHMLDENSWRMERETSTEPDPK